MTSLIVLGSANFVRKNRRFLTIFFGMKFSKWKKSLLGHRKEIYCTLECCFLAPLRYLQLFEAPLLGPARRLYMSTWRLYHQSSAFLDILTSIICCSENLTSINCPSKLKRSDYLETWTSVICPYKDLNICHLLFFRFMSLSEF